MRILDKKIIVLLLAFISLVAVILTFFTNLPKVYASHSRVNLLTADNFAVLGGAAISDTGTTAIIGNVGLDPTGGASLPGSHAPR